MAACRLCRYDRQLRRSHIIPEFFFRPTYDDKHRAMEVARDDPAVRFIQKGHRDRLLCDECEGLLGEAERRFANHWFSDSGLPQRINEESYRLSIPDYETYKTLLLSILWRAGESGLDEFEKVSLGPHSEKIRQSLLAGTSIAPNQYPVICFILVYPSTREVASSLIVSPFRTRIEGRKSYIFVFGGCAWLFVTTSNPLNALEPLCMQRSLAWEVPVKPIDTFKPVLASMREHFRLRDSEKGRGTRKGE